jgi:hypothetical protein
MSQFNLNSGEAQPPVQKQKKVISKKMKIALGAAVLLLIPILGTTFAASIAVNGGGAVQFGQGVASVEACDQAIKIKPDGSYDYDTNSFYLETVTVDEINTTDCNGKVVILRAFDSTTKLPVTLTTGTDTKALKATFSSNSAATSSANGSVNYTLAVTAGTDNGKLVFSLNPKTYGQSTSSSVLNLTRFTFESSNP